MGLIEERITKMDCQDWTEVKIGHGSGAKNGGSKGGVSGTQPRKHNEAAVRLAKLDAEDVPKPLKKHLSAESRQGMIKKRIELGMNQVKFNQACAFPTNTVRDFENGHAVPTGAQLNIMSRVLGITLRLE